MFLKAYLSSYYLWCMYMCAHVCKFLCTYVDQMLITDIFLHGTSLIFEIESAIEPGANQLAAVADQ